MSGLDFPRLRTELQNHVLARTGNRLRNLEVQISSEGVCLTGETGTFYVKQLAQHSVREVHPNISLKNDILVV